MLRKNFFPLFLVLFFISVHSLSVWGQSTEEILEKMIEAQGGREILQNINDTILIGFMEMVEMGIGGSLTIYQKEPNLLRQDAKARGALVTQAYDGEKAWMTNPITGGDEEMPWPLANDFARSSLGNDALLHPEKYGIVYVLEGKESVGGKDYFVLSQTFPDGFKAIISIDPETHLIHHIKNEAFDGAGNKSVIETFFSDYKKVEAVTLAHSIVTFKDGKEFMKMEISEVKFNTGLEDSFFRMRKKQPPRDAPF